MNEGPDKSQPEDEADSPTVTFTPVQEEVRPENVVAGPIPDTHSFGLVVERGPRAGMTYLLEEGLTRIGRGTDQDIVLDDVTVSRSHAVVEVAAGAISMRDVGSTNGTYVNGERLDATVLAPGDEMIIGKFHLIVARGG